MMQLRRLAFTLLFYGGSVPIVVASAIAALVGQRPLRRWVVIWLSYHRWCARHLLNITVVVEGTRPTGPALYPAKHQAMFETFELTRMLDAPAIVMKRELTTIPLWGWAAQRYGVIVVDRDATAGALRRMMRDAQAALAQGRSVVIFPEGTRVPPGQQPPLKSGFAGLYRVLKLPTVPIAINSGRLLPRHGPKRSGVITLRFGETISPDLPRARIEALVHAQINVLEPRVSPVQ